MGDFGLYKNERFFPAGKNFNEGNVVIGRFRNHTKIY